MAAPICLRSVASTRFPLKLFKEFFIKRYFVPPTIRHFQHSQHWCAASSSDEDGPTTAAKVSLNLAKPGKALEAKKQAMREHERLTQQRRGHSQDKKDLLDEDLVAAARDVAKTLGGDEQQTENDLLKQLKNHMEMAKVQREGRTPPSMRNLFSGMKVEKTVGDRVAKENTKQSGVKPPWEKTNNRHKKGQMHEKHTKVARKALQTPKMKHKLFEGPGLGIFSTVTDQQTLAPEIQSLNPLFDAADEAETASLIDFPAKNAWQEAIQWTKQGKLWTFPLDNEQGMEEESRIGFHEHVFLDHLLEPFPKKGPVRHFMELVVVGLSKNPYITVQQKHDHVTWFRDYFEDKYPMIEELLVESMENRH